MGEPSEAQVPLDASGMRIAIVAARFNEDITDRLLDGALAALEAHGLPPEQVAVYRVPGAFELPLAAQRVADPRRVDAVVCLGAVIRGETPHFEYVSAACANGLGRVTLDSGVPVAFGVLTTDDVEQARARAGGREGNKGAEAARAAVEMVQLLQGLPGAGTKGR